MTKQEIINAIENMIIYEKDYETLLSILNNSDDRFFVKLIEEILLGNIYISDFERIFQDDSYSNILKKNLESQDKLNNEITRLLNYRRDILGEDYAINFGSMIGIVRPDISSENYSIYQFLAENVRKDLLYQMLKSRAEDSPEIVKSKFEVQKAIDEGRINEEDILLFVNSQIIPVAIEHQILDESDLNFMVENNLSEDEMRKMKALSTILRRGVI